jgi:hypothetical protein
MRLVQTFLVVVVAVLTAAVAIALLNDTDPAEEAIGDETGREGLIAAIVPVDAAPDEWNGAGAQVHAAPGAVAVVADPLAGDRPVFRLTVDESDVYPVTPTENPRAQLLTHPAIEVGEEFWLRTSFLLPRDLPPVPGWMSLVSVYGPPFDGSSPWQMGIRADELMWQRNATYDYDVPWRMPLVKGRWVDVLVHQRFASDGWVEMWIDGERVTFAGGSRRLAMATADASNGAGPNHAKIMQYRQAGMFQTATVYFGALRVGATRASVAD